jgi:hypothetical protein
VKVGSLRLRLAAGGAAATLATLIFAGWGLTILFERHCRPYAHRRSLRLFASSGHPLELSPVSGAAAFVAIAAALAAAAAGKMPAALV